MLVYHKWTTPPFSSDSIDPTKRTLTHGRANDEIVEPLETANPDSISKNFLAAWGTPRRGSLPHGRVHYRPRPGEDMTSIESSPPVIDRFITLSGDAAKDGLRRTRSFGRMTFHHARG